MPPRLAGKVAIVTGSGSGIGQSIAERLAQEGADCVVDYRGGSDSPDQTIAKIQAAGGKAIPVQADVSSLTDTQNLVDQAYAQLGRCDILVNNAGIEKAQTSGTSPRRTTTPSSTSTSRAPSSSPRPSSSAC
jgi:glucose 1-dehydrogenase